MKIALLIQRFPGGGAEKYVEEIASRLHKRGEDVTVITSENKGSDDSKYGFKIIRLPSIITIGEYSVWRGLEGILKRERFDIVHANTYGYYHSDKAARLKEKLGYRLVMTSHGFTGMDLHKLKKEKIIRQSSPLDFLRELYDEKIGKKTLLLCDHLIALSQYDFDFYRNLGIDESKITVIPPGVSDVFFEDNPRADLTGDPVLLSVGQLSWIKNQEMIVRALPCLLSNKPNAHLYLIGPDGGKLAYLKRLCEKLQVDDHVTFLGYRNSSEVCSYMKAADLLLQTSLAEGLSTVLLEAMVVGLPFVTTPTGGNESLVKYTKFGMVIKHGNVKEMCAIILNLLDNNILQKEMQHTPKLSQHHSWDDIFLDIFDVYKSFSR